MDAKPRFQRATKRQARLRMAIDGPAGSGKTYTALIAATCLAAGGTIAVIDTEHGSASKYADLFQFDTLELDNFHPQHYLAGIQAAEESGYAVIVIDSLSHAWEGEGGVLELHEQATKRTVSQNSWAAWRDVTPIHRRLVEAILQSRCHVICTMRSRMEYIQTEDDKGRKTIQKVGLAPVQRQGMEYEFDVVGDMNQAHDLVISKTRMAAIDNVVVNKPNGAWFERIRQWLSDGASAPKPVATTPQPEPAPSSLPQPAMTMPAGNGHGTPASWLMVGSPYDGWTNSPNERAEFAQFREGNNVSDADAKRLAATALEQPEPLQYFRDFPGDRARLQAAILWAMDQEVIRAGEVTQ